jgi:hypothetical protein
MADGSAHGVAKSSRSAAIGGVLLALPFAAMLSLLMIGGGPPPLGPLEPFVNPNDRPNVVGSAIVVGAWLLALIAFLVNVVPVVRNARAGRSLATSPANLLVAAATFALVAFFVGAIIVDQYPCWTGVPNCD